MERTVKYTVEDMHCSACEMRLEALEEELSGIIDVRASYASQVVTVKFDDTKLNPEQILQKIQQFGYTPCLQK